MRIRKRGPAPTQKFDLLTNMGGFAGTEASEMDASDEYVNVLLSLAADDEYTTSDDKFFSIQLAPTSDPTKFLGFIEVNIGNMSDQEQVTGIYATESQEDFDHTPGLSEVMMLAGAKTPTEYAIEEIDPYMLRELIQAIYVEAPDKSSGKRRQNIHIKYDGIGFIPLEELMKHE